MGLTVILYRLSTLKRSSIDRGTGLGQYCYHIGEYNIVFNDNQVHSSFILLFSRQVTKRCEIKMYVYGDQQEVQAFTSLLVPHLSYDVMSYQF